MRAVAASAADAIPPVDASFDRYATAATVITLPGGRTLNLDCRGTGRPTVLLFSGIMAWSEVWLRVHDRLAEHRRVCAFDPAGMGFSGPSPGQQDAAHIVADLEAALTVAKITGPYLVVGHSAGGLQALAFVDHHRREVEGLVLVDPSYPGIVADVDHVAPTLSRFLYRSAGRQRSAFQRCAEALGQGPMTPDAPDAGICFNYRSRYSAALKLALAEVETPDRMRTKVAQLDGFPVASRSTVDPARDYGNLPLIVLTRGNLGPPPGGPPPGSPPEAATEGPAMDSAWVAGHEALAKLSTGGEHRIVAGAGHIIQLDKPEAVIQAVEDVASRESRR